MPRLITCPLLQRPFSVAATSIGKKKNEWKAGAANTNPCKSIHMTWAHHPLCFPQWSNFTWLMWTLSSIGLSFYGFLPQFPRAMFFFVEFIKIQLLPLIGGGVWRRCLLAGVITGLRLRREVAADSDEHQEQRWGRETMQHPETTPNSGFPLCKILWWVRERERECCRNKKKQQLQLPAEVGMCYVSTKIWVPFCGSFFLFLLPLFFGLSSSPVHAPVWY